MSHEGVIPFHFKVGDYVVKQTSGFPFKGFVVSAFRLRSSGAPNYAVESADGTCMIFNQEQLKVRMGLAPSSEPQ